MKKNDMRHEALRPIRGIALTGGAAYRALLSLWMIIPRAPGVNGETVIKLRHAAASAVTAGTFAAIQNATV